MCHANSLNFMVSLTYCGAPVTVYDRRSFDPEHLLRALVVIGRKLDYQLGYGSPAVFPDARIMRIADTAGELVDNRRGDPEMLATPALALDAMVEAAGNRKPALEQKWAESLRAKQRERVAGRAATCPSGARTARCTRA